jgi:bacterioferritin
MRRWLTNYRRSTNTRHGHLHLDEQGFARLAGPLKRAAIVEIGHVEKLTERILLLKGSVKMTTSGPVEPIAEPAEILTRAAAMEQQSAHDYNKAALQCSANADAVSKQLDNIKRLGRSYLALQSFEDGPAEPGTRE